MYGRLTFHYFLTGVSQTFTEIQKQIKTFISKNVSFKQFQGKGLSGNDQCQVYFEIGTNDTSTKTNNIQLKDQVMVVGFSEDLFHACEQVDVNRPFRSIITAYFQPKREMLRKLAKSNNDV